MAPVVQLCGVTREYVTGDTVVHALRGVDFTVEQGEMIAILGASGSGKSTLLNILGCLERPSAGSYHLDNVAVDTLDDDALADIRNQRLGFVFQGFNLLSRTTALDNVTLPMVYDRTGRFPRASERAAAALRLVGLEHRMTHFPNELSGGQQQRVAIARALVTAPTVLLADEPTGNLDSETTMDIMALFQRLNDAGVTLIVVTHEDDVAATCKRAVTLSDGGVLSDVPVDQRRLSTPSKEVS